MIVIVIFFSQSEVFILVNWTSYLCYVGYSGGGVLLFGYDACKVCVLEYLL